MASKFIPIALAGAALLLGPSAFGANTARPGSVNYVEGAVYLDGQQVTDKNVGSIELNPGNELSTRAGKAEILLTPGVFLRLDDNSTVQMISPDLTHTQVALEHGRAGIEVDEIHDQNNLDIVDAGVSTQLVKNGYYEFNADQPTVLVFDGKAAVEVADGKYRVVKSHHELALVAGPNDKPLAKVKPAGFDTTAAKDDLYNWNSLRSQYLAEANNQIADQYAGASYYPGWYWDPYTFGYTYLGAGPFIAPSAGASTRSVGVGAGAAGGAATVTGTEAASVVDIGVSFTEPHPATAAATTWGDSKAVASTAADSMEAEGSTEVEAADTGKFLRIRSGRGTIFLRPVRFRV